MHIERAWTIRRGDVRAASAARRDFAHYLAFRDTTTVAREDAELIFGELVANAVKCAQSTIVVELVCDEWATLRVIDDGDCFTPVNAEPRPTYAESGRGLSIVKQLARDVRVGRGPRGCEVTAILHLRL